MNELIKIEGIYRTALATPGLLIMTTLFTEQPMVLYYFEAVVPTPPRSIRLS